MTNAVPVKTADAEEDHKGSTKAQLNLKANGPFFWNFVGWSTNCTTFPDMTGTLTLSFPVRRMSLSSRRTKTITFRTDHVTIRDGMKR
ncbi:hypothetical protein [Mesorhizobium sp. M0213]|uniref:hypothetical protein n=1 Tax=Mesorhizobium sp. M0213 TaxID=2956917 RepID=UPI0033393DC4